MTKKYKRNYSLDIIRLIAILLMFFAHTISYLYTGTNPILLFFKEWGNIVCFTSFVFVSGAVNYLSKLKHFRKHNLNKKKLIIRILYLYIGYYLLSLGITFIEGIAMQNLKLNDLIEILLFIKVPGYTEFLIPFIAFNIFLLLFPGILKKIAKKPLILFVISLFIYLLGEALFLNIDLNSIVNPNLKIILTNYSALIYGSQEIYRFPILQYLPIFLFGLHWGVIISDDHEDKKELIRQSIFMTLLLIIVTLGFLIGDSNLILRRWPPSLAFISIGIAWTGLQILLFEKIKFTKTKIIKIYKNTNALQSLSKNAFLSLIIHTFFITGLNFILKNKILDDLKILILFVISVLFTIILINLINQASKKIDSMKIQQIYVVIFAIGVLSILFIGVLSLKQNIEKKPTPINTPDPITIEKNLPIKSNRLWHIPKDKAQITFTLPSFITQANIDKLSYEIYKNPYSKTSMTKPISKNNIEWKENNKYKLEIPLSHLEYDIYDIVIKAQTYETKESDNPNLNLNTENSENTKSDQKYIYTLLSNPETIYYSAPIYMTWTMDWEGYDLSEKYMEQIANLSSKYKMPVTQFFNPRIYTNPSISNQRAQILTNWVKERAKKGDEIALHIHMHYDLVKAANITPKTSPAWGGRTEGHDVLTTAYNYDEFSQIVNWGINQFKKNGLGTPKGYRAGGWFLDLENMRVLNDLGFVYDSSGMDYKEPYGTNKQVRDWDHIPTTHPYQVSFNNLNSSKPPLMNIWEYPNNGADSTNREPAEMIKRFNLNLNAQNKILKKPQVITYLSHPHWFNIDGPKLEELFAYTQKYKYNHDKGVVKYVTLIEAHENYTKLTQD